jgi:hypothetical protein
MRLIPREVDIIKRTVYEFLPGVEVYLFGSRVDDTKRGTFIDKINRAEKRGVIDSAQALRDVRDLGNEIAHEYSARDISELFKQPLALAPSLLNAVQRTIEYSQKLTAQ